MPVEAKIISPTGAQVASEPLISPVNENIFGLTQRGKLALEVVRLNNSIEHHNNPDIAFAMVPSLLEVTVARRGELCRELGMPEDEGERATIIANYKQELERHRFPHWKVVSSLVSTDEINSEK